MFPYTKLEVVNAWLLDNFQLKAQYDLEVCVSLPLGTMQRRNCWLGHSSLLVHKPWPLTGKKVGQFEALFEPRN
jgi:hypothetical protein